MGDDDRLRDYLTAGHIDEHRVLVLGVRLGEDVGFSSDLDSGTDGDEALATVNGDRVSLHLKRGRVERVDTAVTPDLLIGGGQGQIPEPSHPEILLPR